MKKNKIDLTDFPVTYSSLASTLLELYKSTGSYLFLFMLKDLNSSVLYLNNYLRSNKNVRKK